MKETQSSADISLKLQRIAKLAKERPELEFTALAHHIDEQWVREAHRRVRKDAAAGVDGQTAQEYGAKLEENLRSLLNRAKSGEYRAPPVRRVHIPKGDGSKTRPLGVPTFEDKVLQRAVVMLLEPLYEQEFVEWSYGFRRGRSQHQMLDRTWKGLMRMGGGWVVEVDVQSFFDELDHGHLREFFRRRVRDGVLVRLLGKWLKAGVLEDGAVRRSESGTPQGGVVSPLLANIYLHYVFDKWFEEEVRPRLRGPGFAVRWADDIVLVLAEESDADRMLEVLPKRFGRYGLRLHPDKTRKVDFRRPPKGGGRPGTFDLLGFTHHWGKSRRGKWVVRKRTARDRFARTARRLWEWCRKNRHRPVAEQQRKLNQKLAGHDAYYGVTGNGARLKELRRVTRRAWQYWLNRRSQRARMTWERFKRLLQRFPLREPRVVHSIYRVAKP